MARQKANLTILAIRKSLSYQMTDEEWVKYWRVDQYEMDYALTSELVEMHAALHRDQEGKEAINELILNIERRLSMRLATSGLPERYDDKLSRQAGTYLENPPPITADEVFSYLRNVGIDSQAVAVIESMGVGASKVSLSINSPFLKGHEQSILKAVNRFLPPTMQMTLGAVANGDFIVVRPVYSLELVPTYETSHVTLGSIIEVQKTLTRPFRIITRKKSGPEQIVVGAVLVPDEPDATQTKDDEGNIISESDIYDEVTIQKCMYYWMENARMAYTLLHKADGGIELSTDDAVLLENWQARADYMEGDQLVKKGTWMNTTRVKNAFLWEKIANGEINAFSVGAAAMAEYVKVKAN